MKEELDYNEHTDVMTIKTSYDAAPVIESNKNIRNSNSSKAIQKYKGDLVLAARFAEGDIIRLRNLGYNILSPDSDEVRRALVYVQTHEPHLMTVHGKPFTRQRIKWG